MVGGGGGHNMILSFFPNCVRELEVLRDSSSLNTSMDFAFKPVYGIVKACYFIHYLSFFFFFFFFFFLSFFGCVILIF